MIYEKASKHFQAQGWISRMTLLLEVLSFCSILGSLLDIANLSKPLHATIISRLDYCDTLWGEDFKDYLKSPNMMEGSCLIAHGSWQTKPYYRDITSISAASHLWVQFKLLLLTIQSLNGLGPTYLSACLWAQKGTLLITTVPVVMEVRTVSVYPWALPVTVPLLWNGLATEVQEVSSLGNVKLNYLKGSSETDLLLCWLFASIGCWF